MPCFKGIAVSVHAEGAPLPEYSVQKQSRVSRINTYIPVPKAKIPKDSSSDKPEPSKFAISITLLVPNLSVPYSTPKPTAENPNPVGQLVADLPGNPSQRGGTVVPYIPLTKSENETIAAYIYFDGRAKEEVATLLRPGEETWVNSRWVQVPESEGGGLAEREFLFREVGLERWLNGLDLDGNDAAAKIEKRRQKFEKRRRRRREANASDDDLHLTRGDRPATFGGREVLRYGDDSKSPMEKLDDFDDDDLSSDSDDDVPEAAGQIKVAMFRVIASGEIKKGEYSPQFDAHDDDEEKGNGEEANIDHTTSFAKPKTLDPKSISTQTVTGIDGPDKPFAVFTFFYRGEKQLQKMGILNAKQQKGTPTATKRRSTQLDFSNLAPLKPGGTVGFSSFRDSDSSDRRNKSRKKSNGSNGPGAMVEDSDDDDDEVEIVGKMEDVDDKDVKASLSPEDAKFSGELADGVGRIKLKRQHSVEPLNANSRKSPASSTSTSLGATPPAELPALAHGGPNVFGGLPAETAMGSPLKKQRASLYDIDSETVKQRFGTGFSSSGGDIVAAAEAAQQPLPVDDKMQEEDEL
ncbi:uncharacterized protein L3040_003366 [Drepanopeziza brunnea f. sp. 'multigermtubi']|uniref:DUF7918 domain-containing protein n=1 Tax=Marssonina brunnea f. sp. multigermtubi (strain MB_m1) TaxID=1072389 RepID=K1WJ27_MARBU|nr:uncharacterized protein MBM_09666 [Drepanopeziza brunnea f. sp. 'multigermtubi' MB_m1]EKD12167.1 hypothetical protein MBM_09666 [Drepanopeziza brunnea f. sp. 'multigermtubi' MB_m1]KAJ5047543.1 hypothetical protein L3040_003366 [Drepanopeziza brunnea f. sp. 'multigermtubi']